MLRLNDIKTGDMALCFKDSELSEAIRLASNSEFSHSATFIWVNGDLAVADSQADGFQIRDFFVWMEDFGYSFEVWSQKVPRGDYEKRIRKIAGTTKYDWFSLLFRQPRKLITQFLNKFRKKKKSGYTFKGEDKEAKRMYCFESSLYVWGHDHTHQPTANELIKIVHEEGFKKGCFNC